MIRFLFEGNCIPLFISYLKAIYFLLCCNCMFILSLDVFVATPDRRFDALAVSAGTSNELAPLYEPDKTEHGTSLSFG